MKYLYRYDPDTFEYIEKLTMEKDPIGSKEAGKTIYFKVPNTTPIEPPNIKFDNKAIVFSIDENMWKYVSDYRNARVINVETKQLEAYTRLGDIEYPFTLNIPDMEHIQYIDYIDGEWVLTKRNELCDQIWSYRKVLRDRKCDEDILYNGHRIHADKVSYNDLLLSAQEILLTGDMHSTKTWITADSDSVTLTGADIVNILRLYGERRQTLVYQSNEQWKADLTLTDDELFDLYDELRINIFTGE